MMQLYLSNLVDLALGKPHLIECEHYNILHALLHVMLKKLNMADSRIELMDQLANKAEKIVNTLPRDPSLCFKEYTLRPGGGKIRKKNTNAICPKKSLLQINRKWPQCCHASSNSSTSSSTTNSCVSSVKPARNLQENDEDKCSENINHEKRIEKLVEELNQRVFQLEKDQKKQTDAQNQINRVAMQEFEKLRENHLTLMKDLKESSSFKIKHHKSYTNSVQNIKIESNSNENIRQNEDFDPIDEITWLKERMLEISESLKLHSECLRKIKCEDLPKIKSTQEELFNSMHAIKCQILKHFEFAKTAKLNETKYEIEGLKNQVLHVSSRICEVEKNLESCKQSTSNEMLTLRNEFVDKIKDQMSVTSEIINIENLEYCGDNKQILSKNSSKHRMFDVTDDQLVKQENNHSCACPKITSSIFEIKKQVSSQSICMQQLVRDLAAKLDRCEFEIYCHEINDTIDSLLQLKNDFCIPTAAGGTIPLLRKVDCISCQAESNMKITASTVPRLQPLRGYPDCVNCCNKSISDANWSCYSQKSGVRRIRGTTRYGNRISRLKCRRLKTPFKSCASPIIIYKSRFRKNSYC